MSSKEILNDIINNFEPSKFVKFFREKSRKFKPLEQSLSNYNNEDFTDGSILGVISFEDSTEFIIHTFKVIKPLSERFGKKAQYILGKKILKDTSRYVGGIFIFYDDKGDFRFSLIYNIPLSNGKNDWSNFRRYTYLVSKVQTNKTFLQQMDENKFSSLDKIIEVFSIEKVTKEFYTEIAYWYFWALDVVEFPDDVDKKREERNAKNLIRLITRIIFVWFMKEKKLVSPNLFEKQFIAKILNFNDKTGSTYYKAILQNLFFASLNTQMKKENSNSRMFIEDAKNNGFINEGYLQQGYYRYSRFIKDKKLFLEHFGNIPFLNGGLFECLDKKINEREIRIDCFSDNPKNEIRLKVPDKLFFLDEEIDVDLSKHLDTWKNKKVRGLFSILKSYNFTIDENTPIDEEIALDPELLGKVFENLLASYIPASSTTARKSTGSYYTPREIVEYMVNESLIVYIKTKLVTNNKSTEEKIRLLFDYNIDENPFIDEPLIIDQIISAIENIKILDPACGSGAFPMGILHKLVLALHKLDRDNKIWKKRLLDRVPTEIRDETVRSLQNKSLDYIRKLGLIEHCIYGVDIQEIAIQISKLRFFISLLVEQEIDDSKPNRDIRSLPNLETKFVAANTLIGLDKPTQLIMVGDEIEGLESILFKLRAEIFYTNSRWEKIKFQEKERQLRAELKVTLSQNGFGSKTAQQIANWDPFDQNTHAEWFDAEWMFGPNVKDGFDIVIGNPPYGAKTTNKDKEYFRKNYLCSKTIKDFQVGSTDTFAVFIENGLFKVCRDKTILCFIVPMAFTSSESMFPLHKLMLQHCEQIMVSTYFERPKKIFNNAEISVSIILANKNLIACNNLLTTKVIKRYSDTSISQIISELNFVNSISYVQKGRIPKIGTEIECNILSKIYGLSNRLKDFVDYDSGISNNDKSVFYRFAGGRYYKIITNYSTGSSAEAYFNVKGIDRDLICAILSSNLSYWFYHIHCNYPNWKFYELEIFPIPPPDKLNKIKIIQLYQGYLIDLNANSKIKQVKYSHISEYREYYARKSKHIIDQIDLAIKDAYGFTDDEINFIINYDLKFRTDDD